MAKRILLLEDNQDILDIICEVLTYEGFKLHCVSNCTNIISEAETFNPDLVIMDYRLKDGNGIEVATAFRAHIKLRYIPLALCSAYLPDIKQHPGLFDTVIHKPFDIVDLLEQVNRLIGEPA